VTPLALSPASRLRETAPLLHLRQGRADDAEALLRLITAHADEGHLLPRTLGELRTRAPRFVVAAVDAEVVACAELAPLSPQTAEVRSLVVTPEARGHGVARRMVAALAQRARRDGFDRLCAFAHDPMFFVQLGFSLVPHQWIPEKIRVDCASCALFRQCGQSAVLLTLADCDASWSGDRPAVAPPLVISHAS
jgi:amino-acid N-acetyltransferase